MSLSFIDTHAHLDGKEFGEDLNDTIKRSQEAGVEAVFVPAIDESSMTTVMEVCQRYAGYCFPMMGLQPEEVRENWREVLDKMKANLDENRLLPVESPLRYIAVGECGLDFYWSREFEKEQLLAFEEQVKWSVEYQLPLMIHCRKAQNELLHILKDYEKELLGGVFHCFTGNTKEAEAFLRFEKFCLGIGGVSTFKSSHLREYLPADTNSLMAVMAEALSSEDKINLIVSSKHPRPQFYSVEEAKELVREGYKVIDWASTVKEGEEPDVVIAAAGTEPNLEALAGISILHKQFPELKIRFINVVDILKLRSPKVDPRGLSDEEFDKLFTADKPVVFCFHGYEGMIRDLFFDRHNHNVHIHGYRENGDITTPFDMRVLSEMDRFHVAKDAAVAVYGDKASEFAAKMDETVEFHHSYIREHGEDIPEVVNWQWENVNK